MTHRTKVDRWLAWVLAISQAYCLLLGLWLLASAETRSAGYIVLACVIGVLGLITVLAYPTAYQIDPPVLRIRSGVLRWEIQVADVEAAYPTHNPLSAPAWSLDRLRIDYRRRGAKRFALISPHDKKAFLRDLVQADAALRLEGDSIRRM